MIEGTVNARHEAVVHLLIQGPNGRALEIEAVVDTGFGGFLTLPASLVAELALPYSHASQVTLADDTVADLPIHRVALLWDGQPRTIRAHITDSKPLIGMLLLDGYSLRVDVKIGGRVVIDVAP